MTVARVFGEMKTELGEFYGVRIFAHEPKSEIRQVAVRAPGAFALLKELVGTMLGDVPEVTAYRRELPLAEQVRLQAVECELVFLLV